MAKNKKEETKTEIKPKEEVNEIFECLANEDMIKVKLLHPNEGLVALAKEIKKLQK